MAKTRTPKTIYSDEWKTWSPIGQSFDVVCSGKAADSFEVFKGAKMISRTETKFAINYNSEINEIDNSICILEQKKRWPVARAEFLREIISVDCNLGIIPMFEGDFRLMGKNKRFFSVKRLTDGRVWMLPTKACKIQSVLPKYELYLQKKIQKHLENSLKQEPAPQALVNQPENVPEIKSGFELPTQVKEPAILEIR